MNIVNEVHNKGYYITDKYVHIPELAIIPQLISISCGINTPFITISQKEWYHKLSHNLHEINLPNNKSCDHQVYIYTKSSREKSDKGIIIWIDNGMIVNNDGDVTGVKGLFTKDEIELGLNSGKFTFIHIHMISIYVYTFISNKGIISMILPFISRKVKFRNIY